MGMYTECYVRARFDLDRLPQLDRDILHYLFDEVTDSLGRLALPRDHFFNMDRWHLIGRSGSHYFQPEPTSRLFYDDISGSLFVCSRSDLKNYSNEIHEFFRWIARYADPEFVGYSLYEEDDFPILYYVNSDGTLTTQPTICP